MHEIAWLGGARRRRLEAGIGDAERYGRTLFLDTELGIFVQAVADMSVTYCPLANDLTIRPKAA